jgi:putative oxidoreductase
MEAYLGNLRPAALSLLRVITALMLFQFGVAKYLKIPPVASFANVETFSLIGVAGLLELVLGGLLLIGLYSRCMAFVLSGEMAFVYFLTAAPKGFFPVANGGTLAIELCFTCLYLAVAGGGPYSVDAMIRGKR